MIENNWFYVNEWDKSKLESIASEIEMDQSFSQLLKSKWKVSCTLYIYRLYTERHYRYWIDIVYSNLSGWWFGKKSRMKDQIGFDR